MCAVNFDPAIDHEVGAIWPLVHVNVTPTCHNKMASKEPKRAKLGNEEAVLRTAEEVSAAETIAQLPYNAALERLVGGSNREQLQYHATSLENIIRSKTAELKRVRSRITQLTCSHEGCMKKAEQIDGVCRRHRQCSHQGCTSFVQVGGLCMSHNPNKRLSYFCKVEDCSSKSQYKGLCAMHGGLRLKKKNAKEEKVQEPLVMKTYQCQRIRVDGIRCNGIKTTKSKQPTCPGCGKYSRVSSSFWKELDQSDV